MSNAEEQEREEKGLENVSKLEEELSNLHNVQVNQGNVMVQDLDQSIERYNKNLAAQKRLQQELESRLSFYRAELAAAEEETRQALSFNKGKIDSVRSQINEAEEDLRMMLREKERHEKALEAVAEEVRKKFEGLRKQEVDNFHDAETIYQYQKLSLTKKMRALDADIDIVVKATASAEKRLSDLKATNRDLRSKYYKLHRP